MQHYSFSLDASSLMVFLSPAARLAIDTDRERWLLITGGEPDFGPRKY